MAEPGEANTGENAKTVTIFKLVSDNGGAVSKRQQRPDEMMRGVGLATRKAKFKDKDQFMEVADGAKPAASTPFDLQLV